MQDIVVVIGLGEVGLAVAVALASRGCTVTGYDIDEAVVGDLRAGHARRFPLALTAAFRDVVAAGTLSFASVLQPADIGRSYIIVVSTPLRGASFDDRPLLSAVDVLQRVAASGDLVVVKSTVPIGTTTAIGRKLRMAGLDVDIAHSPDRSIAGKAFEEQFSIPHIVGGIDARSGQRAARLFDRLGTVIGVSSPDAAEAVKLFANAQRDVAFALANEFALICENLGLDFYEIGKAGASDYPRGSLFRPGPVGGQCLPKDTLLLASSVPAALAPTLSLTARAVNERVIACAADTIAAHLESLNAAERTVAILGVAFKGAPATADVRGSVAVALMHVLAERVPGLVVRAWDAVVGFDALAGLGFSPCDNALSAAAQASAVVIANDHPVFRRFPVRDIGAVMCKPALIYDLCGTMPCPANLPAGVSVRTFGIGSGSAADRELTNDRPGL